MVKIVLSTLKKTILSDELKLKLDKLEKHEKTNHFKKHYNELDFPQTQFLKLSYKEFSIQEKINSELVLKNYDGKYHSKSNFWNAAVDPQEKTTATKMRPAPALEY